MSPFSYLFSLKLVHLLPITSRNLGRLSAMSSSECFLFFLLDYAPHIRIMSSHSVRIFFKTFFSLINFHNCLWSANGFCFEILFFLMQAYFIICNSHLPSSVNLYRQARQYSFVCPLLICMFTRFFFIQFASWRYFCFLFALLRSVTLWPMFVGWNAAVERRHRLEAVIEATGDHRGYFWR